MGLLPKELCPDKTVPLRIYTQTILQFPANIMQKTAHPAQHNNSRRKIVFISVLSQGILLWPIARHG